MENRFKNWNRDNIYENFKLPIYFSEEKEELDEHIYDDLELTGENNFYEQLFKVDSIVSSKISKCWKKYYTANKSFLTDTQNLIENIHFEKYENIDKTVETYEKLQKETEFLEKYNYIEWNNLKFLNNSPWVLGFLSFYNICSPLVALIFPLILCLIPYFILKLQGLTITWDMYWNTLLILLKNQALGQLLTNFSNVSLQHKIYLLFSSGLYLFQFYNNIRTCIHFHYNMKKIHGIIDEFKDYIKHTIFEIEKFEKTTDNLKNYLGFVNELKKHKNVMIKFYKRIEFVDSYKWNLRELTNLGTLMKEFYYIYSNEEFQSSLTFTFGFHGYLENLTTIKETIKKKEMNLVKFNKKKKTKFIQAYYPTIENTKIIKNDYDFKENMIITGPNASGKTTLLKTTIINVILSQQFGCGFYKKGYIHPYDKIHCYLNIPDTSGRDSLFQAEARRCNDILKNIVKNKKKHNFCIFDELYSGTNPYEAVATGVSYIKYLVKQDNVHLMLTTHFIELCKHLDKNDKIQNYLMEVNVKENFHFEYLYKLNKGISKIKGGVKVLRDLKYPEDIINESIRLLNI